METTIMGYIGGYIRVILGLCWDNEKENGNSRDYRGLYRGYIGYIIYNQCMSLYGHCQVWE